MLTDSELEELWFVVSPQNPLKLRNSLLADRHRLQMVRVAIEENYKMRACDVEFHLPIPSYTVVTLAHLREQYPDREFCLIMGSDNLESFHKWRNYEYILENYQIYVYPRPGHVNCELASHPNVHLVNVPMMDISSSYIRERIKQKRSVEYLLSEPVYKYLTEMHFYECANV